MCNKVSKGMFYLRRVKHILPSKSLKTIYYALIHPYLLYGILIFSCSSQKNLLALFRKQKACLRIISDASYNAHTQPLFLEQKILTFPDLITMQTRISLHSLFYNYSTVKFEDCFKLNYETPNSSYSLRNNNDFSVPKVRLEFLKRFPFYSFPKSWNLMPGELKGFMISACLLVITKRPFILTIQIFLAIDYFVILAINKNDI